MLYVICLANNLDTLIKSALKCYGNKYSIELGTYLT